MEFTIRTAEPKDASTLAGLIRGLGIFAHITAESADATDERVARHLSLCLADDSHSVYAAERGGEMIGYMAIHWLPYLILTGPEGYISELFIAESARGQGVGAALLETAEAEARQRGCSRLMLLNIRQRESYQRRFYSKHGWEERPDAVNFVRKLL